MTDRPSAMRLGVLTAADIHDIAGQLADISGRAFAGPPWHRDPGDADRVVSRIALMARGHGFKMVDAEVGGKLIGFAYGKPSYTGASPPPWEAGLVRAIGPDLARRWIRHGFEVVSVVVDPEAGVKGVGTALVNHLLRGLAEPTAWFGVDDRAAAAIGVGLKTGFREIAHVHEPGRSQPRLVLAREIG